MKKRRDTTPSIRKPEQVRVLASPLRQEILDALESAGPCSIAELGGHLGRAPDALYFHVRRLLRSQLVIETGRKQVGRHAFATYDVVARPLRIDRRRAGRADMRKVAGGILRLALRDYGRGLEDRRAVIEGTGRNHWVARAQGFLDASALGELNERLESVLDFVRAQHPGPDRIPVALSFAMTPVAARRAATKPAGKDSKRRATRTPRARRVPPNGDLSPPRFQRKESTR